MKSSLLSLSYYFLLSFVLFICIAKQEATANFTTYSVNTNHEADNFSPRAISLEYMSGTGDMHGARAAYRFDTHHSFDLPLLGDTRIEYEASFNGFDLHGSAENEASFGLSFSPVLVKALDSFSGNYPIALELGIGVAYVHDSQFGGVDIGSDYQFEDRLGIVMQLGQQSQSRIALRLIHYSNGGFNTKNPGLDFISLAYIRSI